MKKNSEDDCPLCGQYIEIRVTGFSNTVFIDGKKYPSLCFCCAATPKDSFSILPTKNELNTVQEMIEDGWDKKTAELSLKAVKAAIKRNKNVRVRQ